MFELFAFFAYTILSIEFTLRWNSISGVKDIMSTGQLIALTYGLATLGFVFMKLAKAGARRLGRPQPNLYGLLFDQGAGQHHHTSVV